MLRLFTRGPSPVPTVDATLERLVNEGRHKRLEPEQIALVMIQRYRRPRCVSDDDRHVISIAANCCVTRVEAVEGQLVEQQAGVPERQMAPDNPVLKRGHRNRDDPVWLGQGDAAPDEGARIGLMLQHVAGPDAVESRLRGKIKKVDIDPPPRHGRRPMLCVDGRPEVNRRDGFLVRVQDGGVCAGPGADVQHGVKAVVVDQLAQAVMAASDLAELGRECWQAPVP